MNRRIFRAKLENLKKFAKGVDAEELYNFLNDIRTIGDCIDKSVDREDEYLSGVLGTLFGTLDKNSELIKYAIKTLDVEDVSEEELDEDILKDMMEVKVEE